MANGIYFGADTLEAEEASALKQIRSMWEQHGRRQGKKLGIRNLVGTGMDIAKKFTPWAHVADPFVTYATQELTQLDKFDEDAGFWTAKEVSEMKSQDKELREGADTTLLENILGSALEYAGTEAGGEAMGEFGSDFFSGFGGGGMEGTPVADTSDIFRAREGGKVPKYENGGRAPKKEDIEEFKALYDLFSKGQPTVKSGKPMFTEEGGYSKDYFAEELGLNQEEMSIDTLSYTDPRNYEFEITGDGRKIDLSQKGNIWPRRSTYDKKERVMRSNLRKNIGDDNYMRIMNELNPDGYDTLLKKIEDKYFDMDRFKQMDYDMKNFEGGGMVQGGGTTTIVDYFGKQGISLGGSNKQSLAEMLGRK